MIFKLKFKNCPPLNQREILEREDEFIVCPQYCRLSMPVIDGIIGSMPSSALVFVIRDIREDVRNHFQNKHYTFFWF